ncbi:MAG: hypothetical protein Q8K65_10530 [Alphaproteobacteria bacterium]|nr:hypothetical protein [Alphaproteobacteria bacterium]
MSQTVIKYSVDNDYTLSETTLRTPDEANSFSGRTVMTRTFNFLAQQVTTHVRDSVVGNSGGYKNGGAGGISTALTQQHFEEFRSDAEIVFMHKKLKELKGNPPPLEEITRGLGKKGAGLSPAVKG